MFDVGHLTYAERCDWLNHFHPLPISWTENPPESLTGPCVANAGGPSLLPMFQIAPPPLADVIAALSRA